MHGFPPAELETNDGNSLLKIPSRSQPNINTRKLVIEEGGFLYDSDSYADDLPYWNTDYGKPHLVIPYTLSENDMRFASPNGFSHGGEFSKYLKDSLR